jgi:hypothetical protein
MSRMECLQNKKSYPNILVPNHDLSLLDRPSLHSTESIQVELRSLDLPREHSAERV